MKSEFETWPATPVEASLEINEVTLRQETSRGRFFLTNGAAGVGRPFERQKAEGRRQKSEISSQRSEIRDQLLLCHLTSDL
jgi:hypothetical protein